MESSPTPENPSPSEPEKIDSSTAGGGGGGAPPDGSDETDQDREYGCKYCQKKFSNKQALGGHQNAHKLERAMEKNVREVQESHFGYFSGAGLPYPGMVAAAPFLGSYNRSHEYLARAMYRPYHPPHQAPLQQAHEIQLGFHNPRPGLPHPMPGAEPYPPRPVPGFNNVYSGAGAGAIAAPVATRNVAPFPGQVSPYVQNQGFMNPRFLALGLGSSQSGSRARPDSEFASPNDQGFHHQHVEDSGLDLSLKL